jgi:hypothetical protein
MLNLNNYTAFLPQKHGQWHGSLSNLCPSKVVLQDEEAEEMIDRRCRSRIAQVVSQYCCIIDTVQADLLM